MTEGNDVFLLLLSDEVYVEGVVASDVASLWRRLARCESVQKVARHLSSDPKRIHALCVFLEKLLGESFDQTYAHPREMAICAGLVVLGASPLSTVRHLFARLLRCHLPSLVWVRRMAEYCDERRVSSVLMGGTVNRPGSTLPLYCSVVVQDHVCWRDENGRRQVLPLVA